VLSNSATAVSDLCTHLRDTRWGMLWYRREVSVDPACFARLIGRYRMRPHLDFNVTASEGRLLVQLTGQPAFRVFPMSEWHFFYKVVGAQITFEPEEDGRAARLILHQSGMDQIAERISVDGAL
jgi:serine-type D-Ala-D-Ala carboxypeptidase/endopeptidase